MSRRSLALPLAGGVGGALVMGMIALTLAHHLATGAQRLAFSDFGDLCVAFSATYWAFATWVERRR